MKQTFFCQIISIIGSTKATLCLWAKQNRWNLFVEEPSRTVYSEAKYGWTWIELTGCNIPLLKHPSTVNSSLQAGRMAKKLAQPEKKNIAERGKRKVNHWCFNRHAGVSRVGGLSSYNDNWEIPRTALMIETTARSCKTRHTEWAQSRRHYTFKKILYDSETSHSNKT